MVVMSDPVAAQAAAMAAAIAAAVRTFNIELWLLYAIGVLVTILRTYARVKAVGFRNLRADDFIIWIAIVRIKEKSLAVSISASIAHSLPPVALHHAVDSGIFCRQPWPRSRKQ